jgi:hypothetical protein
VNRYTLPNTIRVPLIQELSQQFHGSRFITRIDFFVTIPTDGLKEGGNTNPLCLTRSFINLPEAHTDLETLSLLL